MTCHVSLFRLKYCECTDLVLGLLESTVDIVIRFPYAGYTSFVVSELLLEVRA